MLIKEVTFVLEENAQMYTGNTVEIVDVGSPQEPYYSDLIDRTVNPAWADGGWSGGSSGDNRKVSGPLTNGGRRQDPIFRSQLIDGRIVLWAAADKIQAGKDQFAVVAEGVNLDHIWSSWRGQRWVNRANVDDGLMSFKDLVDFHKDEVFSTFSLPTDSLTWIDENTLDLSNNEWLTLGLNPNYSMSFTYADSTTIVRGGGDNQSFGNRTVTLNWVQFTDSSGEVVVVEDGVTTEGMQVYDESNVYVGRDETVVREETISTPNLTRTEYTWRIIHVTKSDNLETGDVDESQNYWQVQSQLKSTSRGWDYGGTKYDNQLDADNALDATIEERMNTNNTVGENNASQAATDAALAKQKAAKEKKNSWFSTIDKDDMKSLLFGGALVVLGVLLVSVLVKKGGGEGGE